MARVFVSDHPLVRHKLTLLRSIDTEPKKFRELVRELAILLAYEATRDLGIADTEVITPMGKTRGTMLSDKIGLMHFVDHQFIPRRHREVVARPVETGIVNDGVAR